RTHRLTPHERIEIPTHSIESPEPKVVGLIPLRCTVSLTTWAVCSYEAPWSAPKKYRPDPGSETSIVPPRELPRDHKLPKFAPVRYESYWSWVMTKTSNEPPEISW